MINKVQIFNLHSIHFKLSTVSDRNHNLKLLSITLRNLDIISSFLKAGKQRLFLNENWLKYVLTTCSEKFRLIYLILIQSVAY